tara:strand:- start:222 stop:1118 length:897 start_codon:yes stop_codon:yes gene_type:complete
MPFIGKSPTAGFASIVKDDLTPNGSTTAFTLSKQVANANDIAVFLGNVRQEPTDAYTVSGTTLTMSEAPDAGLNFYVLHIAGTHESSVIPADGTISSAKIVSGAVTDAKIAAMAASKLTGAMPALDGSALTGIEAFTRATIDFGSSVYSFTGLPSTTEIIHLVITNATSTGDIRVRLRAGGNIVSSNNFTGLDYRYTAGSNSWTSAGGANYTTGIAQLGNWGSSTLNNAILTILRNHSSTDSNPSFHCSGLVFYRNYGTHGGAGRMIGLNTGLGAAFDGVAFASSNSITAGKATIYYR